MKRVSLIILIVFSFFCFYCSNDKESQPEGEVFSNGKKYVEVKMGDIEMTLMEKDCLLKAKGKNFTLMTVVKTEIITVKSTEVSGAGIYNETAAEQISKATGADLNTLSRLLSNGHLLYEVDVKCLTMLFPENIVVIYTEHGVTAYRVRKKEKIDASKLGTFNLGSIESHKQMTQAGLTGGQIKVAEKIIKKKFH